MIEMTETELFLLLTWASPYIGALLSLMLSKLGKVRDGVAVLMLFISALSSTLLLNSYVSIGEGEFTYPWVSSIKADLSFYVDGLSSFMALIVAWLSFLIGFYSLKYMEGDAGLTRYWFFFDFFVGSMLLLVLAGDLIPMFIGWEGTGLASYALIGHWYTDDRSWVGDEGRKALGIPMYFTPSHSGIRAIVFTRIGDVGFISGIATLLAIMGSSKIPIIAHEVNLWSSTLLGKGALLSFLIFFSLGAIAKSAQFPFHEWLVTAMTGPTSVSALIHAATMVKAGVYFMLRFMPIFYLASEIVSAARLEYSLFFTIIATIGAFTAFFMASQAIVAREIKLILAFSTASQLGYMFLGAGAAGLIEEFINGFLYTFSHLMSHAIFKASLFLAAGAIIHVIESRYMDDAGMLLKYMKITFIAMFLAALSLSGIPPFMGFWTKDSLLEVVYEAKLLPQYILGVVTAGLTAFYSMRLIFIVFNREESKHLKHLIKEHAVHEAHPIMLTPYSALAIASLLIGIVWPIYSPSIFNLISKHVLAIEHVPEHFEFHLDVRMTMLSLSMAIIGLLTAYACYVEPRLDLRISSLVEKKPSLLALRNFLYDRWLINSIYYIAFVRGGRWFSNNLFKIFDKGIIDGFYHSFIPWLSTRLSLGSRWFDRAAVDEFYNVSIPRAAIYASRRVRRIQTGKLNHYLLIFFTGLLILTIIILVVI